MRKFHFLSSESIINISLPDFIDYLYEYNLFKNNTIDFNNKDVLKVFSYFIIKTICNNIEQYNSKGINLIIIVNPINNISYDNSIQMINSKRAYKILNDMTDIFPAFLYLSNIYIDGLKIHELNNNSSSGEIKDLYNRIIVKGPNEVKINFKKFKKFTEKNQLYSIKKNYDQCEKNKIKLFTFRI